MPDGKAENLQSTLFHSPLLLEIYFGSIAQCCLIFPLSVVLLLLYIGIGSRREILLYKLLSLYWQLSITDLFLIAAVAEATATIAKTIDRNVAKNVLFMLLQIKF